MCLKSRLTWNWNETNDLMGKFTHEIISISNSVCINWRRGGISFKSLTESILKFLDNLFQKCGWEIFITKKIASRWYKDYGNNFSRTAKNVALIDIYEFFYSKIIFVVFLWQFYRRCEWFLLRQKWPKLIELFSD